MEPRSTITILTHTVKRYLNGYLFLAFNSHRIKDPVARQSIAEMEKLETQLKDLNVTPEQFDKILNYGQIYKSLLWTQTTDVAMKQVMKVVFSVEI